METDCYNQLAKYWLSEAADEEGQDAEVVQQGTERAEEHDGGENAEGEILEVRADLSIGKPANA